MKLLLIALIIFLPSCSSLPDKEEQPSRIERVVLDDGRVVDKYIIGYSIEDFMCEWNTGKVCEN